MAFIIGFFILIYVMLIGILCLGFSKLLTFASEKLVPKTSFSICIAFRNEAKNLPALLNSLQNIRYHQELFEIVLVNDHSTDDSVQIITDFCLKNTNFESKIRILSQKSPSTSGKKAALHLAIKNAKNEFIITTDADCIVPKTWLSEINAFTLKTTKSFIAGPVALSETPFSLLNMFQELDFLSLQGATQGAFGLKKPFLCNGANLAFAKKEFFRLNGYAGNREVASGDDIFLMQKFQKDNPKSVGYLKSQKSIVYTQPQHSWKNLIEQRKRWAAKASTYTHFIAFLVSWAVLLANFASIIAIFYLHTSVFLISILILKIVVDFILIAQAARFFSKRSYLWGYLWSFLVYPFFTLFIAISSQLQSFEWKGRQLKK
ncbi:MAG TPA: glycosyltransferase [Leeuwenhoekiella sp.]|nr:glycosyltransferase [Leeuwenhoekiella sp.]